MQIPKLLIRFFFLAVAIIGVFVTILPVMAYVNDSAHGNITYGVLSAAGRSTENFARANCAHCHQQHASVSSIPPANGEKGYLLFDKYTPQTQTSNFCFSCHGTGLSAQFGGQVTNRSYSYRAGNWSADTLNNIETAFGQASSHNINDIITLASGPVGWKYTADSNGCAVCHDPHLVNGDPGNAPVNGSSPKSGAVRLGVITEINSSPVKLWGAVPGERMNPNTTTNYQAPYRFNSSAAYEPAGSTQIGTDLPDYVTFCSTCHDAGLTVASTDHGTVNNVLWANEKHGQVVADDDLQMLPAGLNGSPYGSGAPGTGYVLSCMDCHESHGSTNQSLIRAEINGVITGVIAGGGFDQVCARCHNPVGGVSNWDDVHHAGLDPAYNKGVEGNCNNPAVGCHNVTNTPVNRIVCSNCHYHGAKTFSAGGTILDPTLGPGPANRILF